MERIGIRELRQNASKWVAKAQSGATIDITSRGHLVARLVPVTDDAATRDALIDAGHLLPARVTRRLDATHLIVGPQLTPTLEELREDR
ncbi:MAG: type II toxin-antitoxin system Phd/YefM family antitoxin [Mycobacterium sp.]